MKENSKHSKNFSKLQKIMSNEKEKMSDLAALEMTEKRLEELERRVYGSGESVNTRKDEFSTPLVPKLAGKSCYYITSP